MISKEEWVAIKILAARSDPEKSSKEVSILKELSADSTRDNAYVVALLDDFFIEGPNGRHHCLVLELLGPTLDHVIKSCLYVEPDETRTSDHRIGSEVILRVSQQLLRTLVSLHEEGIAHGGTTLPLLPLTMATHFLLKEPAANLSFDLQILARTTLLSLPRTYALLRRKIFLKS